jgi:UDP-glucose 4-epimerase
MEYLRGGGDSRIYNLGSGDGYSVKEVLEKVKEVTGVDLPVKECPRRSGDPGWLIASRENIFREQGWQPKRDLTEIIRSAWAWETKRSGLAR